MNETWKPIPGTNNYYQVSNCGRVRSLDRTITFPDGRYRFAKGRVLKPRINNGGHEFVSIKYADSTKVKKRYVHRLVAQAFIGEPPENTEVCHWDGNPRNNQVENLRYGTRKDNRRDDIRLGKNYNVIKTHCPRGHRLVEKNLIPSTAKNGGRGCLACSRAMSRIRDWKDREDELQDLADRYFESAMAGTYERGLISA